MFYPKPRSSRKGTSLHTLHVKRALAFYLDRTRSFRSSTRLFVSTAEQIKGCPTSTQRLAKWVSGCDLSYYEALGVHPPPRVIAYSTRAQSTSVGIFFRMAILDVCRAAKIFAAHILPCALRCHAWLQS